MTPSTKCSLDAPFVEAGFPETADSNINTDADERLPRLTSDELVLYFHRNDVIYRATRASRTDKFGAATAMPVHHSGIGPPPRGRDAFPVNGDSRVYFTLVSSPNRVQVADRVDGRLRQPRNAFVLEKQSTAAPFLWRSTLFFRMDAPDGAQLWSGDLSADGTLKGRPTQLPSVGQAGATDSDPTVSEDGLALYYSSTRGGSGGIWLATRADTAQPFSSPRAATVSDEASRWIAPGFLSADYCRLYVYRESEHGSNRGDLGLLIRQPPPSHEPTIP